MSAPALAERPTLLIRGTPYPVLLPTVRDPRLHLAAVIVSLQVLGQAAFDFRLSIAQILISLGTCAVLEVAIAFRRQRVIMWPASALLTGNGVAFILRVPGTEHGDWWSLRGWWIFAATAAVSLLSKYVIQLRGRHLFNPSNIGLVLCFLVLGSGRAEPLDFWWSPMSAWMALALVIIVAGGLAILARLHLVEIAVAFWLSFAAGIGVLALTGHEMTASWHLGPITGADFWWVLVSSPEILVFLFFMITDPKTIPAGRSARIAYAVGVGSLAAILIAPTRTEFWSKVAVLGALAIVCAARPLLGRIAPTVRLRSARLAVVAAAALAAYTGLLVAAGIPARPDGASAAPLTGTGRLPQITILPSRGVSSKLDRGTARQLAADLVTDLRLQSEALKRRDPRAAARTANGEQLYQLLTQIRAATGRSIAVPAYRLDRMRVWLERGEGQKPAIAVAATSGRQQFTLYTTSRKALRRGASLAFRQTIELVREDSGYLISNFRGAAKPVPVVSPAAKRAAKAGFAGIRLTDVARQVGLDFRHGAFRFGVTHDVPAMMGGGLCWLDYDNDGWLDLFVVNSYSEGDIGLWYRRGGLPRTTLFRNLHGRFVNVTNGSHAGLPLRGQGCAAADLNGDGHTDVYVTTASSDALLWNNGNGTFTEGARAAGLVSFGWHSGAAVADVNGDGRLDLFVAGYTEEHSEIPGSDRGFPTNQLGVRDRLFVNEGSGGDGRAHFREVGAKAGLDPAPHDHTLGAVFTDVNSDGRLDLFVANDEDPNRLYLNLAGGPLGFRFVERARNSGVADANAGMGIADGDFSGDRRPDLFVSNSRGQTHAVYRSSGNGFVDARGAFTAAFGRNYTGWGVSWADLNNDGNLDLVLANGAIPVKNLARDAGPIQALENLAAQGRPGQFAAAGHLIGLERVRRANGRGLAAADYDNDGRVDFAVNSIGGPLILLRSTGATGHWLEVKLRRFVPGAVVTAVLPDGRRLVREVQAGSSYLSSEDPRLHFGLGRSTKVRELLVRYPGGAETRVKDLAADRIVTVGAKR
jgi:Na+-transporting NADH:ubiquinone oxidoreductase subunit NqrB